METRRWSAESWPFGFKCPNSGKWPSLLSFQVLECPQIRVCQRSEEALPAVSLQRGGAGVRTSEPSSSSSSSSSWPLLPFRFHVVVAVCLRHRRPLTSQYKFSSFDSTRSRYWRVCAKIRTPSSSEMRPSRSPAELVILPPGAAPDSTLQGTCKESSRISLRVSLSLSLSFELDLALINIKAGMIHLDVKCLCSTVDRFQVVLPALEGDDGQESQDSRISRSPLLLA